MLSFPVLSSGASKLIGGFYFDRVPQVFQDKLQAWMKFKAISLEERNFDLSNDLVRSFSTKYLLHVTTR